MATPCVRASLSLLQPGAAEAAELEGTHALYPDRGCAFKGLRKLPFIPDPGDPVSSIVLGGHLHSRTHELPPYTYAHIPENKNKP